jgi:cytochrome oxidase assembly protein ShyY1
VVVAGRWHPDERVLVAGRVHEGVDGFWSVTAVRVCADDSSCREAPLLPVVLGWSATQGGVREPPSGRVEVTGWLQPGEAAGSDADPSDDVLPTLRIPELLQRAERDFYGGYLILNSPRAARAQLEPVTPESLPDPPTFTALRNLLYGIEWWLFALFAVFLWWRWSRDEVLAARSRTADDVTSLSEPAQTAESLTPARIPSEP